MSLKWTPEKIKEIEDWRNSNGAGGDPASLRVTAEHFGITPAVLTYAIYGKKNKRRYAKAKAKAKPQAKAMQVYRPRQAAVVVAQRRKPAKFIDLVHEEPREQNVAVILVPISRLKNVLGGLQ